MWADGQRYSPVALPPGKRTVTHFRGRVGPKNGLDECGKYVPHTGTRSPDRPARSESLYRLSYPVPQYLPSIMFILQEFSLFPSHKFCIFF